MRGSHHGYTRAGRGLLITSCVLLALVGPSLSTGALPAARAQSPHARLSDAPVALSGSTPRPVLQGKARLLGHYNPDQMLRLVFGLQPPNIAAEEQFLHDVQTKGNPLFHHYLTADEWNARFAPAVQDEQAVADWAQSHGLTVTHRYPNRLLVDVAAKVSVIEKAFNVSINTYQYGARTFYANDREPAVPGSLAGIVHAVLGLNSFEVAQPHNKGVGVSLGTNLAGPVYVDAPVVAQGAASHANGDPSKLPTALKHTLAAGSAGPSPKITGGSYDPTDLYSSQGYDYSALQAQGHCCNPFNAPEAPARDSIGIATAFAYDGNDLTGWGNAYPYLAYNVQPVCIDGCPGTAGGGETTEDLDWTIATANSFGCWCTTAKVYVYEGVNNQFSTFTDVYNQMLSDGAARSFTTSWGCTEFSCTSNGTMDTDHNIFNQMIGQGWTLVAASDDKGPYADCSSVSVQYPSSDPDFVAAGGTNLNLDASSNFVSEHAWTGGSGAGSCGSNDGGGGGGCSGKYTVPSYQSSTDRCGGSRNIPDVSLNADWVNSPENIYLGGGLQGNGGTSIVAPELAGFFAQENAYLDALGYPTAGQANYAIYNAGRGFAPHNPFYDVTSGCTSNDVGGGWCAGSGYDLATGWGSANMLQLAWAVNWYDLPDFGRPTVTFSGPTTGQWYNANQTVSWTVADTGGGSAPSGVAGFSQAWDADPGDPSDHATPGCCDSFYNGPQFPNATSGSLSLAAAGQGCHTANVQSWDNMGYQSGDQTYGPVCYDTIFPSINSISFSPASPSNANAVTINASASDPGCGSTGSCVSHINYWANTATNGTASGSWIFLGSTNGAAGSFTWNTGGWADGTHLTATDPCDGAGNCLYYPANPQVARPYTIDKTAPHTTISVSGAANGCGAYFPSVQFTLAASDAGSGVASTVYQVDGGAVVTYSGAVTLSTNGSHTVTFHSVDKAGNVEATQTAHITIASPTLSRNPTGGVYGTTVAVSGTNYLAGEPIKVYWDSTASSPVSTLAANASCSFAGSFSVPEAISGTHTIIAVGQTSHRGAKATFVVKPRLVLNPATGLAASKDVATGHGFAANEKVKAYWSSTSGPVLGTTTASALGGFGGATAITYTVPMSATGTYTVIGVGQSSGYVAKATYVIHL